MADADSFHRLIYCSRAYAETRDLDAYVEAILEVSVRNNREAGLTGLLLVHDGWFLQALEGAEGAVARTYGRIACDRRHEAPKVLGSGTAPSRLFGQWSLSAHRLDKTAARSVSRRLPFDPTRLDGGSALALLSAAANRTLAAA